MSFKIQDNLSPLKSIVSRYILSMMLDDTRGGLDASSLHRAVSMDIYISNTVGLLSCHRNTSKTTKTQTKNKLRRQLLSFFFACILVVLEVFR